MYSRPGNIGLNNVVLFPYDRNYMSANRILRIGIYKLKLRKVLLLFYLSCLSLLSLLSTISEKNQK